jgi:hypothetical protein
VIEVKPSFEIDVSEVVSEKITSESFNITHKSIDMQTLQTVDVIDTIVID